MKFLDLFAGIGGFRLGNRQGHKCIGFCEIDKFARKSYKAIYETKGEIEFHDIRQVTDQDFRQLRGQMDIICGDSLAKHF
ncbi:DNA cytosine methyltransferase, partial [Streptococcus equi subsp. zooepidemicus]|uniref:DNA cytosine methyltransferase n=1 Tax=Streptococcus equi TaxID=1336 RepID=UPI002F2B7BFA|nr:DNA cytosine methyltransferase [Streptococcus equi subsp. zooepidemicus]